MNERLALIVYDMQFAVVQQIRNKDVIAKVRIVLDAARDRGCPVFFTRHMWLPTNIMGAGQLRRVSAWHPEATDPRAVEPPFRPGDADWQIVPDLEPRADEVVLDKITMSCFEGTFLPIALRDAGINTFAIAGIALEVGIEPSVKHGLDLNFIPIVIEDACGYKDDAARRRCLEGFAFTGEVEITDAQTFARTLMKQDESAAAGGYND